MNKTIWMCWFQGEDHESLCGLNRKCVNRWKELNPKWEVNVLSNKTISNYVPKYFDIIKESKFKRSPAARSDLLRLLLLCKYGGVWVDVSVYPMLPLDDFISDILNDVGFFAYRIPGRTHGRETASWFLCVDNTNHYLINLWKLRFIASFKNDKHWTYLRLHHILSHLYDTDRKTRDIIRNMVQISAKFPHSAQGKRDWSNRLESYMYKRPQNIKM